LKDQTKTNSSIKVNTKDSQVNGDIIVGGHNSTIVKQTVVQDNSIKYNVDREDNSFLETIAPIIIEKFGKMKVLGIGIAGIISGILSLMIPSPYLFWIGFILLIVGFLFIIVYKHHSNTQCKKCNREFAYEEIGNPEAREVPTHDGLIKKTITRTYKCKFCGDVDTRNTNKTIDSKPDSDKRD